MQCKSHVTCPNFCDDENKQKQNILSFECVGFSNFQCYFELDAKIFTELTLYTYVTFVFIPWTGYKRQIFVKTPSSFLLLLFLMMSIV